MASGWSENPIENCEQILFTLDPRILNLISKNDKIYLKSKESSQINTQGRMSEMVAVF